MNIKVLNDQGVQRRVERLRNLGKEIHPNFINTVAQIALNQMILEDYSKKPEFRKLCIHIARELLDAELEQTSPIVKISPLVKP